MAKREEVTSILNNRGFQIEEDLLIAVGSGRRCFPLNEIIEPFLDDGRFGHLKFSAEHICNEIVIPSIEMLKIENE